MRIILEVGIGHAREIKARLAPVGVNEGEIVVEAGRIAQTGEIGRILVGGPQNSPVIVDGQRNALVLAGLRGGVPEDVVIGVIDRARSIPVDDGVSGCVEQWNEVHLIQKELNVRVVDDKRLEGRICDIAHDNSLPSHEMASRVQTILVFRSCAPARDARFC